MVVTNGADDGGDGRRRAESGRLGKKAGGRGVEGDDGGMGGFAPVERPEVEGGWPAKTRERGGGS